MTIPAMTDEERKAIATVLQYLDRAQGSQIPVAQVEGAGVLKLMAGSPQDLVFLRQRFEAVFSAEPYSWVMKRFDYQGGPPAGEYTMTSVQNAWLAFQEGAK